ncbi:MAG: aldehyde dehydrogenase family protein, partial [Pseudomonadota bacterium]
MSNLPHYPLFINGQWREGSSNEKMHSISPATGEPWATFACASADDVNEAVTAAKAALQAPQWRNMLPTARGKLL